MHLQEQAKTIFQLQTELINTKVDITVSKAISQVVEQIINLRQEMHQQINGLRQEMHQEISSLRNEMHQEFRILRQEIHEIDSRLSAVETALGMRNQVRGEMRTRFLDYSFRTAWIIGTIMLSATTSSLTTLAHQWLQ